MLKRVLPSLSYTLFIENTRPCTVPLTISFIYHLKCRYPSAVLSCWLDALPRVVDPVAFLKADWKAEWKRTLVGS
jgi:hypothetical protein